MSRPCASSIKLSQPCWVSQERAILNRYNFASPLRCINRIVAEAFMTHRGVDYTVALTTAPGVWQWQFRIGDRVKTGKTETNINLLAIRRVQLRIDRELRDNARS